MCVCASKSCKKHKLSNTEPQINKIGLIYILVAFLFYVHMKVSVADILDFFLLNVFVSSLFLHGPLSYYKYAILSSTCVAVNR